MNSSAKNKVFAGFLVVVVILAVLSVIFYYYSRKYQDDMRWITHTGEVSLKAFKIENAALVTESNLQGYLLLNDESFLNTYKTKNTDLNKSILELKKLVSDNPIQIRRCDTLLMAENYRFRAIYNTLNYFNKHHSADSNLRRLVKNAKTSMVNFSDVLDRFKMEEDELLKIRIRNNKQSNHEYNLTYLSLIIFICLTITPTYFFLIYHLKNRKKNEKIIRRNWQVLQSIMDNIPTIIYKKNLEGRYVQVNKQFAVWYKRDYNKVIGKNDAEIFEPSIAAKNTERENQVRIFKSSLTFEDTFVENDVEITMLTTLFPIKDERNELYAICGMITDISDRIEKEEKLQYQSFMINNASDAIIGCDMDFKINSWNNSATLLYGFTEKEALGKYVFSLLRSKQPPPDNIGDHIKSELTKSPEWRGEFLYWRSDDKETPVSTSCSIIIDKSGKEIGILAINRNIEREKSQEESIKNLNYELEAFTYSVSHDLRAPLRSIEGYSKILLEDYHDDIDPSGQKILHTVIRNSKQMSVLIDDLLAFSKVSRQEISKRDVDPNKIVQNVIQDCLFETKYPVVCFDISELTVSEGDPKMLYLVWSNLISNAVKYSRKNLHPKIEIGCISSTFEHVFYVRDNGVGFDTQYYNKLFGVFQRLHTIEEFEGTGVGLALVQRIISKHNGKVWAESILGEGSSFYFSIPITKI